MPVFQRISDILSANLHEMLDKHEQPERMLRLAVSEMEDAIHNAKREIAKSMASEAVASQDLATNQAQVELWTMRARQAVESSDDHLARKALVRKKEHQQLVQSLELQVNEAAQANRSLREQLSGMQTKLVEARRQLEGLVARQRAASIRARIAAQSDKCDLELDRNAFERFDRLSRKVQLAEAEAEALADLSQTESDRSPGVTDAFDLEEELERLKERYANLRRPE